MAADIATTLNAWSSTSSSNQPDTSDPVGPNTLAQNLQVIQSVMRAAFAGDGTIASATTTDLSTVNDGDITVSGTTTITGFGTLTAGIKKILTFSGALTLTHNATSLILPGAANITTAAGDVAIMRSLGSGNWKCISFTRAASLPTTSADIQVQLATAFTTGGTATAFTLTPAPAITANAANQRFRVKFNAAAGTTPTLAVSGLTALNLKYKDSAGTKQAITSTQVPSGWISDVENDGTDWVVLSVAGIAGIPQNIRSAAYTTVLADANTHILHPSADTTARTFTIDSNANVPYPIGTAITFVNQNAAGVVTIAITTDTMRLAGAGTTGSRTLAANGIATALKITSTEWIISGTGLT